MNNRYFIPLHTNGFYHIYNRGNNGNKIFYSHQNYIYFLKKYDEYLSGYLDTYAYCLLPNHFHLLVKVKENIQPILAGTITHIEPDKIISEAFRRFFTSYAKSINKQEERKGSLFQKNFKRIEIKKENYFTQLIYYIHANPQKHCIMKQFMDYPYSSYKRILNEKPTKLQKEEVIEWFGSKDEYINFHKNFHKTENISHLIIDEI